MAQVGKKRYINTRFWEDSFIQGLNPLDRYLFLYFLTNPHTNIAGIYEVPLKIVSAETGLEIEMIKKMIRRFEGKIFYIRGWVFIKNFTRHQAVNSSMKLGEVRILSEIPRHILDKISLIRKDRLYPDYPPSSDISKSKSKSKSKVYAAGAAETERPKKLQDDEPMDLPAFEEWTSKSPHRHINIIGLYAKARKPKFVTRGQWNVFIKRNLRPANLLAPFSDAQIQEAAKGVHGAEWMSKWTLETVIKFLIP